jgi:hypothetical protein
MDAYLGACDEMNAIMEIFDVDQSVDVSRHLIAKVCAVRDAFKEVVVLRSKQLDAIEAKAQKILAGSLLQEEQIPHVVEAPVVPDASCEELSEPVKEMAPTLESNETLPVDVPMHVEVAPACTPSYANLDIVTIYIYELPDPHESNRVYVLYNNGYAIMVNNELDVYCHIIELVLNDLGDMKNKYLEIRAYNSTRVRMALDPRNDVVAAAVVARLSGCCMFWAIEDYSGSIVDAVPLLSAYKVCMREMRPVRTSRLKRVSSVSLYIVPIYLIEIGGRSVLFIDDKIAMIRQHSTYDWFLYMQTVVRNALFMKYKAVVFRCPQYKILLDNLYAQLSDKRDDDMRISLMNDLALLDAWDVGPNNFYMGSYPKTHGVYMKWKQELIPAEQKLLRDLEKSGLIK